MKYAIILCDGMADYKIDALGGKTPMEVANKPTMDMLASKGVCGLAQHVPAHMVPESDTANLSVMGYDPAIYSKGRSPLEAMSIGLSMKEAHTAFRTNVVTLTEGGSYEDKIILDHSSGDISTAEADELLKAVNAAFANEKRHWYTGVSYRHCLLWEDCPGMYDFTRPHDILGKRIGDYLPKGEVGEVYKELMEKSYEVLWDHPVNKKRKEMGKNPANSIWLWSPGKKPALPLFSEKFKKNMAVICAVDLIKGIGKCAGADVIDVAGATGNYDTNYAGKGKAAVNAFKKGTDLVYVHVEAPDECGHGAQLENKVRSIELIDEHIVKPIYEYLKGCGEDFKIMLSPDHPTPVAVRTHTHEPVPFVIYSSKNEVEGITHYTEDNAAKTGVFYEKGHEMMDGFIKE